MIGRGGAMLKAIGTRAAEIEAFPGRQGLPGSVREGPQHWREDSRLLEDMGLGKR
jgi:hypothetical protein